MYKRQVLNAASAGEFQQSQALRQRLLRELTTRGGHLTADGAIRGEWLYPPKDDALAAARRYRQVVVTQRYVKGKDVFPETPVTFRYFREEAEGFAHQDGRPYQTGEVITDRPIDLENPALITYGVGIAETLINPDLPFAAGGDVYKRQDKKLYMAMSRIESSMRSDSTEPADHSKLPENKAGATYTLSLIHI